jgi:hypothetical protein
MSTQPGDDVLACPYRGLEPFDERDAAFFFGRERETRLITASLFASPLTLLYGASGVGKSSVLRAGVLPRLRARSDLLPVVFPSISRNRDTGTVVVRGWQTDPVSGVKETVSLALFDSAGGDPKRLRAYRDVVMRHDMSDLYTFLGACSEASDRRLMVILDQFEEYSLYHPEDDLFAAQFPQAIVPGTRTVSFLVSLREDALAKLDRFKGRIPTLWDSYRRIDHLERSAAEDAVRLPLREYNRHQPPGTLPVEIEDELVQAVLRDVQTESVQFEETGSGTLDVGPGADARIETPYLQLVMTRLWEREQADESRVLRWTTLQSEGGAAEIVRTHLDRVMQQFTPEEQDMAARVFHRLVTPTGAKIAFSVQDLAEYESIDVNQLAPILQRLEEGSRRILRRVAVRGDASEEPRYEIFHDRLGKAILAWRAKRLTEHARHESKRHEAEQIRIANQARARALEEIDAAIERLGPVKQSRWAKMMFYLVSTTGASMIQDAHQLAELSGQAPGEVEPVLEALTQAGILRRAYDEAEGNAPRYEVVHDVMAGALLEWHAGYVAGQTQTFRGGAGTRTHEVPSPAASPELAANTDFPYALASELLRKGRVVPFLGAGVSLSARPQTAEPGPWIPSNRDLKELLAKESRFPASEFESSDLAEVASYFVHVFGRELLNKLLADTLGRPHYTPSETHRYLADVARTTPLVILTTNYDTLMEQALRDAGVPHDIIAYLPDESGFEAQLGVVVHGAAEVAIQTPRQILPERTRTILVRLHGPVMGPQGTVGSYVITEEDQIRWLARMNTASPSVIPRFITANLRGSSLLSLGHSGRDWSQRALFHSLVDAKLLFRHHAWAVALRPALLSIMTWQRYYVKTYDVELNEWAARMRESDKKH